MTIVLKNKHTLKIQDFFFKCCIGKNGISKKKREGDKKTPKGKFEIENLYFRKDRLKKPVTKLKCIGIKDNMGWCNDIRFPHKYNKLIKIKKKIKYEKLKRKDFKYDLMIPLKYNFKNPIVGLLSALPTTIFIYRSSLPLVNYLNSWIDNKRSKYNDTAEVIDTDSIPIDD